MSIVNFQVVVKIELLILKLTWEFSFYFFKTGFHVTFQLIDILILTGVILQYGFVSNFGGDICKMFAWFVLQSSKAIFT